MSADSNPIIELLTRDDLAQWLKISRAGVYRLIEKRVIPFIKVGGLLRFDKKDVLAYLQKNRVEAVGNK
ncbi:helix-turn-helix domain-containing protein [Patescibacteria group bacterium]|nr:helix-turn-helix domain-containing protein [Patescibacteria group bacterium]